MTEPLFDDSALEAGERFAARANWAFVKGVVGIEFLPPADRIELAFAGRSNVGKSSLINAFAGRRALARASNTPGRTQELNYFTTAASDAYLVDMPGYGYAEAPKAKVEAWTKLIRSFLRGRQALRRVFVLIDSRHGLKPSDEETFDLLDEAAVTYQAVLTKIDKIKPAEVDSVLARTRDGIARRRAAFPLVLITSAETGAGIPELRATVAQIVAAEGPGYAVPAAVAGD
jgi:GTP-binding protein